jgi:hypothetical protein
MLLAEAPGAVQLMLGGDAGGTLPPLLHPSTSLEQAVADDTLGIGFAAAG